MSFPPGVSLRREEVVRTGRFPLYRWSERVLSAAACRSPCLPSWAAYVMQPLHLRANFPKDPVRWRSPRTLSTCFFIRFDQRHQHSRSLGVATDITHSLDSLPEDYAACDKHPRQTTSHPRDPPRDKTDRIVRRGLPSSAAFR
jgi:hypothetical protein